MFTCRICAQNFESIKELTKHLFTFHKYSLTHVYEYFNFSFETLEATCPICGKNFVMTKRQVNGFKKNPNKSIGCCTFCSKSLIIVSHGSPLANPEIYKKTKETLKENYGVEHPAQSEKIRAKMEQTMLSRRGVKNSSQSKEAQEKRKQTNLKRYGTEHAIGSEEVRNKAKETLKEHYGVENAFQSEEIKQKIKKKHLEKFGVDHPMKSLEVQNKMKKTNLKNLGVEYPMQSKEVQEKTEKTNLSKYKVKHVFQLPDIIAQNRAKSEVTMLSRYGVKYFCQHPDCFNANHKRISEINKKCQELLSKNNIKSELEFILENSGYDLKVGNILIEINPTFTHNSTVGPVFSNTIGEPKASTYHLEKTNKAIEHGFHCIHIFDWDEYNKIIALLIEREKIYARSCTVEEVSVKRANEFLESYHIQGATRQVKYAYGLFNNEGLIQVMTFGKPRYNKNYEYELLRLCTLPGLSVIGGASRLLKNFEKRVHPNSIISYCDLSKFSGEVYEKIGFKLLKQTPPARHWYNPKTRVHITDNLLRQRGFDQLHGTSYGKGTSNEGLMLEHGYMEVYDCGQLVFIKN